LFIFQEAIFISIHMSWNVLITARVFTTVGAEALKKLREAGCNVILSDSYGPLKGQQLLDKIATVDATLASPDGYAPEVLRSPEAARLKIISRWGVGYDSIHIPTATEQGIVVAYTPGLLNETVADWTFALLLGIARRIHLGHITVMEGKWTNHWGHDIHGKTLGLIGCGRIGQAVAKRASGFDMKVVGYDIQPCSNPAIRNVSLDELLETSDFVSIHAAATPENRGLIGEAQLRRMKPSSYLINTARGPLVNEAALTRALKEGWIGGAALDVFCSEPLPLDNPLRTAPNLLLTPHLASFARETGDKVCLAASDAIIDLMEGRKPRWVVDPEVYHSPALRATLK
jgi:phosphoglycerate dehydrogenase-like enzyme